MIGRADSGTLPIIPATLVNPLRDHGVRDFHEAGDVGAVDIIDETSVAFAVTNAVFMNVVHDELQATVHFVAFSGEAFRILRHLQTGSCHAACIGGFSGTVMDLRLQEYFDGLQG